ncbi:Probable component of the lipoprotein assembly complex (forms a complex with YaeT, YfgL, and NlpB) [hydrothermal vent metagenome]|uniref:Probable component of the lipoprotein assembly complex (Forms a complex with YaeT, YfgL, and NlpB) n=1 Tax=hydrothermal vent metagenome TaxID=652676 RepID=A0A3B0VPA5_9ZZZZ
MSVFMIVVYILMKKTIKRIFSLGLVILLLVGISACNKNKKSDSVEVTKYSAETLYNKAKKYMELGIWDNSILGYKNLRNQYPFGRYAEQGSLELAYSYYRNYEMELAISTLERFIKNYPAHEHLDYAHYLKGLIYFESDRGLMQRARPDSSIDRNQENAKQSFVALKTFIEKFPNSSYAADAEKRLIYLRNQLAAYELQVAKYYLRRQAYVAAVNRCKYIVESFQQTEAVADAIAVMAEAYRRLGQDELAESSKLVLQTNYPNHQYLNGEDIDLSTKLFSFKDLWIFSRKSD